MLGQLHIFMDEPTVTARDAYGSPEDGGGGRGLHSMKF